MKREINYLRNIVLDNGESVNTRLFISNKAKEIKCSFMEQTKNLPEYYKIVLPLKIMDGTVIDNEKIQCDFLGEGNIEGWYKSQKTGKQLPIYKKETLEISPTELIERYKLYDKNILKFDADAQKSFFDNKAKWIDFTALEVKYLTEVDAILKITNKEIKVAKALNDWNQSFGSRTWATACFTTKTVLFNQSHCSILAQQKYGLLFKSIYTHELAHLYADENGHGKKWIETEFKFNKEVFGEERAKYILAKDLVKYGFKEIKHKNENILDYDDFQEIKNQASLCETAKQYGWKIDNNNNFLIKEFNRKNPNLSGKPEDLLEEKPELFELFEKFEGRREVEDYDKSTYELCLKTWKKITQNPDVDETFENTRARRMN